MHGTLGVGASERSEWPGSHAVIEGCAAPKENHKSALRVIPSGLRAVRGFAPDTPARYARQPHCSPTNGLRSETGLAIYHLTAKAYSRQGGHSSTAGAAYRAGVRIEDALTGTVHDYTRRQGVAFSALCLPGEQTADRAEFWNRVEAHHKRGDAITCREVEVALPAELSAEKRQELAHRFARHLAERYGVAADVAIHEPSKGGDERNHHAHILLSSCSVNPDGSLGKKAVALDPIACKRAKQPTLADREREHWATSVNTMLAAEGVAERVDHRSLLSQQADAVQNDDFAKAAKLDRPATKHEGKAVTQARRGGRRLPRAMRNDRVRDASASRVTAHADRFDALKALAVAEGRLAQVDEQALHAQALLDRRKESAVRLRAGAQPSHDPRPAVLRLAAQILAPKAGTAVRARAQRPAAHKAGATMSWPAAGAGSHQGKGAAAIERASRINTPNRQAELMAGEQVAKSLDEMIEQMFRVARRALQSTNATPLERFAARTLLQRRDDLAQKRQAHVEAKQAREDARLARRRAEADANVTPQSTDIRSKALRALGMPTSSDSVAQAAQEQKQLARLQEQQARKVRDQTKDAENQAGLALELAQADFLKHFPQQFPPVKPTLDLSPSSVLEPVPESPAPSRQTGTRLIKRRGLA
ncbi:TPA: MobA/MobL family protein [Stenotrophomonas maltophilia]